MKTLLLYLGALCSKNTWGRSPVTLLLFALCVSACPSPAGTASVPRTMKVAFVLTEGANVIDLAGPWEVFQDVTIADKTVFELATQEFDVIGHGLHGIVAAGNSNRPRK